MNKSDECEKRNHLGLALISMSVTKTVLNKIKSIYNCIYYCKRCMQLFMLFILLRTVFVTLIEISESPSWFLFSHSSDLSINFNLIKIRSYKHSENSVVGWVPPSKDAWIEICSRRIAWKSNWSLLKEEKKKSIFFS